MRKIRNHHPAAFCAADHGKTSHKKYTAPQAKMLSQKAVPAEKVPLLQLYNGTNPI
jgi:hypothetical protein